MKKHTLITLTLVLVILLGMALRIFVSFRGHNWDVDHFILVGKLTSEGKNIYLYDRDYDFAPTYSLILGFSHKSLSLFFSSTTIPYIMRYFQTIFLSFFDLGIMILILKKFGYRPAIFFFLNPISIIITGYHSQIDTIAIFFTFLGVALYKGEQNKFLSKNNLVSLLLIGLSLSVKHIFIAFPFWLALKEKKWKKRILVTILPFTIPLLLFLPYISSAHNEIMTNVIQYRGINNAPFFYFVLPRMVNNYISAHVIFFFALFFFGLVFVRTSALRSFLYYLGVITIFSPSIAPQYIVIPIILISVYPNIFYILFTLLGTIDYTIVHIDELHFSQFSYLIPSVILKEITTYRSAADWYIALLFLGFIWMFTGNTIMKKLVFYVKVMFQPGRVKL